MTTLRILTSDGRLAGVGLADMAGDGFILGLTMPTMANTGIPAGTTLTTYDTTGLLRTIYADTPGAVYDRIDFGTVRVIVRAANVTFRHCKWTITDNRTGEPVIAFNSGNVTNGLVDRCTIENVDQMGAAFNAIDGHDFTAYRCSITGTVDGIRGSLGGNVKVRGCFIGYLGWFGTYEGGPALNSGLQTHSDCIQTNWGGGLEVVGNSLWAYASEKVGTGTPGNGTNAGNPDGWYTQAQSNARRAELLGSVITDPAKSADGAAHGVGGILCGIMLTYAQGPTELNVTVTDNWFAGGSTQVNGLAENITGNLGTFKRNRHFNDSGNTVAGKAIGYRIRADLTATIPTTGPDVNTYMDGSGVVPRI